MTDRHSGYIVVLERDIREDDAQDTINAIRMFRNVVAVVPVIGRTDIHIAEERAMNKWRDKIRALLKDEG
jgi:septin family protein